MSDVPFCMVCFLNGLFFFISDYNENGGYTWHNWNVNWSKERNREEKSEKMIRFNYTKSHFRCLHIGMSIDENEDRASENE